MIDLEQVPPLRGPRPPGAAAVSRTAPRKPVSALAAGLSRRSVLRGMVASGTALGFTVLGVFPAARRAYAEGYDIWTGACPSYADGHNCTPGCGPSPLDASSCETSGSHLGFHKATGNYQLWPDDCTSRWAEADGWVWAYNYPCQYCTHGLTYRCHDGRSRSCSSCTWRITICRWIIRCAFS